MKIAMSSAASRSISGYIESKYTCLIEVHRRGRGAVPYRFVVLACHRDILVTHMSHSCNRLFTSYVMIPRELLLDG